MASRKKKVATPFPPPQKAAETITIYRDGSKMVSFVDGVSDEAMPVFLRNAHSRIMTLIAQHPHLPPALADAPRTEEEKDG